MSVPVCLSSLQTGGRHVNVDEQQWLGELRSSSNCFGASTLRVWLGGRSWTAFEISQRYLHFCEPGA